MIEPRISLITPDYPPDTGGVARYLGELARHSGDLMAVFVPTGHPISKTHYANTTEFFRSEWPRWWPLVTFCRRDFNRSRTILVSHVFPMGTAAWISHMFGGPEYAVLFHGLDLRLARSFWKQILLRRICRNAKALITNSEATKNDLLDRIPGAHVTVITPGVEEIAYLARDDARARLSLDPTKKIVLSVARLIPRKGIDKALHAMARIQKTDNVMYVVLGDGADRERLENVAREHRTTVTWVRDADDEEKRAWFSASDVFLLPVRDEGSDVEGFGIVFLEAAMAGVPAVAGKSGGAVEAVLHGRTGLVVNPRDVDEIAASVESLLRDGELRDRLGKEAHERVTKEFRWADRWVKLAHTIGIHP